MFRAEDCAIVPPLWGLLLYPGHSHRFRGGLRFFVPPGLAAL